METINKTGQTMASFFASKVGAKSWEEDILGESIEKANINVCKISTFTYDP